MAYETLLVDKKDRVGIVSLNRPNRFNTFNTTLALELNDAFRQLDEAEDVSAVVVKGEGKAFSTGIDITEFPGKTPSEYHEWVCVMDRMHLTIAAMKKPVVAMVHGYAVANGAGLLAAADFALVAEGTKIGTTAINVGLLCTGPIIPVSTGLTKKQVLELLLCGELIDAEEALRLGLVNRVVPADKLEEETWAFVKNLLSKSPVALQMGKTFYYKMRDMSFSDALAYGEELFARLCTTEDAREGVDAFMNKRKPEWKGR